jgi:hypothetical protein
MSPGWRSSPWRDAPGPIADLAGKFHSTACYWTLSRNRYTCCEVMRVVLVGYTCCEVMRVVLVGYACCEVMRVVVVGYTCCDIMRVISRIYLL